jgi:hypothetical protein
MTPLRHLGGIRRRKTMAVRRVVATLAVLLTLAVIGRAQTVPLAETVKPGDCFQIHLDMKLDGDLRVRKPDGPASIKINATGAHQFAERVLAVGATGLVEKMARVYDKATATITVDRDRNERTLRPERKLIVVQRVKEQPLVYSPTGALRREELDVTSEHFDTLTLTGLLPGKNVAVGDTWKVANSVVQALCGFEGLSEQKLEGKLIEIKGDDAVIRVNGTAGGIDQGAMVKLAIDATGHFDLKTKHLTAIEWKQSDDRDQGPVSPASQVQATTTLKRQSIAQPASLSDVALVSVPSDDKVPATLTQMDYRDPKNRFDLLYNREWQQVARTKDHLVLRLMDRGDFIAQATIAAWAAAAKGSHLTATEFREAMEQTPGWEPSKELQAGEVPISDGLWAFRLSALGKLDGVDVMQNFFLIADKDGEQVIVTITMTPKQAEKLGARDLALIGGLGVPAAKKPN